MKRALVGIVAVGLAVLVSGDRGPGPVDAQAPPAEAVVKMPAEVKVQVGRLGAVTIETTGKHLKWLVVGDEVDSFREYDPNPQRVRLRFIKYDPGVFYVVAYTAAGDVPSEAQKCKVIVGAPGPGPSPGPGPGPGPGPTPEPDKLGFAALARVELQKVPSEWRSAADGLAANFETVAGRIAKGEFSEIDAANTALRDMNRGTLNEAGRQAWLPWFASWQARADNLNAAGSLKALADYGVAYQETARGLRAAAGW